MPVRNTWIEFNYITSKFFIEILYQFDRFQGWNMSGRMILNLFSIYTNQVASHGKVAGFELNSNTGCLNHTPTFENSFDIVTKNRKICNFASGMESFRNCF